MDFSIKDAAPETLKTDCVAVAVYAGGKLSPSAKRIDAATRGQLAKLLARRDIEHVQRPGIRAAIIVFRGTDDSHRATNRD